MIDYGILNDSVKHYEEYGFVRVESPWTVTSAVSNITKPIFAKELALKHEDGKVLVASAEQSFLYLYLKGFLPNGRFQSITPCFRGDSFDELHTKYFMKNELIDTKNVSGETLDEIIEVAKKFFAKYIPEKDLIIQGDGIGGYAYDIMYGATELGSYGIRTCGYLEWIYGTGCAEPRLSGAIRATELRKRNKERFSAL